MPFLYEHGLERPMTRAVGIASINHAGFHIRMGYELGVGFYDWTESTIQLLGTVSTLGIVKRSLLANIMQPDDSLPTSLRTQLRTAARLKLSKILAAQPSPLQNFSPAVPPIVEKMKRAECDHLYVPDFRYRSLKDLTDWCRIVTPFVAACISGLKKEAQHLRADARSLHSTFANRVSRQVHCQQRHVGRRGAVCLNNAKIASLEHSRITLALGRPAFST